MKLREKLIIRYLPLWAKETVFYENKSLKKENERLKQKNEELRSFIKGFNLGVKLSANSNKR